MEDKAARFNMKNPAVKRIMQEIKEVQQDTSGDFIAEPLENDIFEWHFVMRGPPETEFEGGIYHGRILLPAEYPFKPPAFMMLSPNGRFEVGVKICLSISSHHPEAWQPSWSVRTALTALIAFMPTPGQGALGALDFSQDDRRKLARKSRDEIPRFGSAERQLLTTAMHSRMLELASEASKKSSITTLPPASSDSSNVSAAPTSVPASSAPEHSAPDQAPSSPAVAVVEATPCSIPPLPPTTPYHEIDSNRESKISAIAEVSVGTSPRPQLETTTVAASPSNTGASSVPSGSMSGARVPESVVVRPSGVGAQQVEVQVQRVQAVSPDGDRGLLLLAAVLGVAIMAILVKKVLVACGYPLTELLS